MRRLFIAIDLPDEQKNRIGSICLGLPATRWVAEEQIHLTLRFIGEAAGISSALITEELGEISSEPFDLRIMGIGHFPPRRSPRVLWLGLDNSPPLLRLRQKIETRLVKIGVPPEGRKFSPHITIARLKDPPLNRVAEYMAGHSLFELPAFRAEEFHLYSSILTSNGAVHQIEASFPLETK